MQSFKQFVESVVYLVEAKDAEDYYQDKFGKLEKLIRQYGGESGDEMAKSLYDTAIHWIEQAVNGLKANHRIDWFLTWMRLSWLRMYVIKVAGSELSTEQKYDLTLAIKKEFDKQANNVSRKVGNISINDSTTLQNANALYSRAKHFVDLGDNEIDNVSFLNPFVIPEELFARLDSIEEKNKKIDTEGLIDPMDDGDGAEAIVRFTYNGEEFVWWNTKLDQLTRKECDIMGHCGTDSNADQFVRLAKVIRVPKEAVEENSSMKEMHNPLLTFAFNGNVLVQSKGSNNDKPSKKYHPHIKQLFLSGFVEKFNYRGSYQPEKNFRLEDMSEEDQHDIEDAVGEIEIEELNTDEADKAADEFNAESKYFNILYDHYDHFQWTPVFYMDLGDLFMKFEGKKSQWSDYISEPEFDLDFDAYDYKPYGSETITTRYRYTIPVQVEDDGNYIRDNSDQGSWIDSIYISDDEDTQYDGPTPLSQVEDLIDTLQDYEKSLVENMPDVFRSLMMNSTLDDDKKETIESIMDDEDSETIFDNGAFWQKFDIRIPLKGEPDMDKVAYELYKALQPAYVQTEFPFEESSSEVEFKSRPSIKIVPNEEGDYVELWFNISTEEEGVDMAEGYLHDSQSINQVLYRLLRKGMKKGK